MTRICDLALGVVLPFHAHVGLNAVISDYIPYAWRSALPMVVCNSMLGWQAP